VVEHSTYDGKIEGLNLATGTARNKIAESVEMFMRSLQTSLKYAMPVARARGQRYKHFMAVTYARSKTAMHLFIIDNRINYILHNL